MYFTTHMRTAFWCTKCFILTFCPPCSCCQIWGHLSLDLWKEACRLGSVHPGLFHSEREAAVNDRPSLPRHSFQLPIAACSPLICDLSRRSAFSLRTNPQGQHCGQLFWPKLHAETVSALTPLVITGGRLSVTWGEEGTSWLLDMNPMTFSARTHTKPKF